MHATPASASPTAPASRGGAHAILWLLTLINLINYVDRYILAAVGGQVVAELNLTQEQFGWIGSALIISYTLLTPVCGWLGDRSSRTKLMAAGVGVWSLATALAGLAGSFAQMVGARSVIGVGEASYASVAPSLIADYFPPDRRATPIGIFNAAIPVGAAIGLILGGYLGTHVGWRAAFFIVGIPGIALALVAYFIREPERGATDSADDRAASAARAAGDAGSPVAGYFALMRSPLYTLTVLGYAAVTFALGSLAFWGPQLLQNDKGLSESEAGATIGLVALVGGMLGTFAGGVLSDRLLTRTRRAYPLVCAVTAALSAVPLVVGIAAADRSVYLPAIFVGVFLAFMGNAPINAIIVNSVAADLRVSAVALSILAIHVLGDAVSQPLVGMLSDALRASGGAVPIAGGVAAALGLDPAAEHLSVALMLLPVAMVVAALFFFAAMRAIEKK